VAVLACISAIDVRIIFATGGNAIVATSTVSGHSSMIELRVAP
jgi:hypothetical protein